MQNLTSASGLLLQYNCSKPLHTHSTRRNPVKYFTVFLVLGSSSFQPLDFLPSSARWKSLSSSPPVFLPLFFFFSLACTTCCNCPSHFWIRCASVHLLGNPWPRLYLWFFRATSQWGPMAVDALRNGAWSTVPWRNLRAPQINPEDS